MADKDIQTTINELVEREQELRQAVQDGTLSPEQETSELKGIEIQLDRCWDLLRQRRARREFGENPDGARERSAAEVEDYRS